MRGERLTEASLKKSGMQGDRNIVVVILCLLTVRVTNLEWRLQAKALIHPSDRLCLCQVAV